MLTGSLADCQLLVMGHMGDNSSGKDIYLTILSICSPSFSDACMWPQGSGRNLVLFNIADLIFEDEGYSDVDLRGV